MSQRYDNTKRPKWKENQLGVLEIYIFCWKIQQRALGPTECCWGCVSMKIHPKNDHILTANVAALRLMSRLHANTLHPDVYWRKWPNQQTYLELCHWNPDILERVLNQIALSNSTVGKCVPMQVTKQTEHGRTSTTKKQKWSSFQMNYD